MSFGSRGKEARGSAAATRLGLGANLVMMGVGFLGGFTTFSTFAVQMFLDFEAGEPGRAFIYGTASVALGLAAAAAGYYVGRAVLYVRSRRAHALLDD